MPDLGKAVYTLTFDTREGEVAVAGMEARADAAASNISKSMGMAETSIASVGATAVSAEGELATFGAEGSASMDKVGASATAMGAEVEAASVKAAGSAGKVTTAWAAAGKSIASTGKHMMRHITLPTVVVGGFAAKQFLDYSQKIKLLQTQAGASASEIEFMRGKVLGLARVSTQGPEKLADAMFHIESVGLRGAKALDVLKVAAQGAQLGLADLDSTTYALVSAQESQLKDTKDVVQTMALLNAIVGTGDMHLQDLTAALSTGITAAAKSAGLGLMDVGAAIDTMTARGQPAQISATRLGMSIALMQKPSASAQKALDLLGIGSLDLAHAMMAGGPDGGLVSALTILHGRLEKVPDPARRAQLVLQAFGGGRSGKAMLTLIQNLDDVKMRYDEITRRGNRRFFDQVLKASDAEPANKLKKAWSSLQVSLVNLGARVVPVLVKFANALVKIADAFSKLPAPAKTFLLTSILLTATFGPLLMLVGALGRGLGFMAIGLGRAGAGAEGATGKTAALGTKLALLARLSAITIGISLLYSSKGDHGVKSMIEKMLGMGLIGLGVAGPVGAIIGAGTVVITEVLIKTGAESWLQKHVGNPVVGALGHLGLNVPKTNPAKSPALNSGMLRNAVFRKGHWETKEGDKLTGGWLAAARAAWRRSHPPDEAPRNRSVVSLFPPAPGGPTRPPDVGASSGDFFKIGKGKKTLPLAFKGAAPWETVPFAKVELRAAAAEAAGKKGLLITALKQERSMIEAWLGAKKRNLKDSIAAQNAITGLNDQIKSLKKTTAPVGVPFGSAAFSKAQLIAAQGAALGMRKMEIRGLEQERSLIKTWLHAKKRSVADQVSAWQSILGLNQEITALRKKNLSEQKKQLAMERDAAQAVKDIRGTFFGSFAGNVFGASPGGLTLNASAKEGGGRHVEVKQTNVYQEIPKDRHKEARRQRVAVEAALG